MMVVVGSLSAGGGSCSSQGKLEAGKRPHVGAGVQGRTAGHLGSG